MLSRDRSRELDGPLGATAEARRTSRQTSAVIQTKRLARNFGVAGSFRLNVTSFGARAVSRAGEMMRELRPLLLLCLCAVGGLVSAAAASARAPGSLVWSGPASIDREPPSLGLESLTSISCSTAGSVARGARVGLKRLCVAGASQGDVLVSTDPSGGPGTWTRFHVDSTMIFGIGAPALAVTCPSTSMCVAGDGNGNVVVSTDPIGAPGPGSSRMWRRRRSRVMTAIKGWYAAASRARRRRSASPLTAPAM